MYPADPFPFKFSQQDLSLSDDFYPSGVFSFEFIPLFSMAIMSLETIYWIFIVLSFSADWLWIFLESISFLEDFSWSAINESSCQCLCAMPKAANILYSMIKSKIAPIKIPAVTLKSIPSVEYPAGNKWIRASPNKAPNAKLNKNFIVTEKQKSDAIFFEHTSTIAVTNPIRLIPKPAKNPNPHLCDIGIRFDSSY